MIIVIHGPQACGKTYNKERLRAHFRCSRIVDGWEARSNRIDRIDGHDHDREIRDGDLVLTCDSPAAIFHAKGLQGLTYAVHDFASAIEAAGGRRD